MRQGCRIGREPRLSLRLNHRPIRKGQGASENKASHVYIHIPFCIRKCHYCDFVSYPGQAPEVMFAYCLDLEREMALVAGKWQPGPVATVYIGGGTPTLLPAPQLGRLLEALEHFFGLEPGAEVTVEANPGTVDVRKLKILKAAGVNRLSLGVQSLDDDLLAAMGRIHRRRDVYEALDQARRAGFRNINVDLIFGLPGQTLKAWKATLKEIVSLEPEHVSCYCLQVEEDTPWGRQAAAGVLSLPGEDMELAMYREAREFLAAAGYEQYEISNFARPGYRCRHNIAYWLNLPYLGLGAAAASHWQGRRWQNCRDLQEYHHALACGRLPREEMEILTPRQMMAETMFMGLRLIEGVDLEDFQRRFGVDAREVYGRELEGLHRTGLLEEREGRLKLTEKGLTLANEVFIQFI
ncbi:MAG: radical SAM family heme chaperone HemW [Moorella sp. (in: firmicutes)]